MKDYSQLNESILQYLDEGYLCSSTCEDHIVFYKMEKTTASIPVVTESIRIDAKIHVQLYFKGCPLPLPLWFREGRNCKLTSLTQLENFASYIRARIWLNFRRTTAQTIYEERTLFHCIDSICSNASITSLQSYKTFAERISSPINQLFTENETREPQHLKICQNVTGFQLHLKRRSFNVWRDVSTKTGWIRRKRTGRSWHWWQSLQRYRVFHDCRI